MKSPIKCWKGYRRKTYNAVAYKYKDTLLKTDPEKVYNEVKERLLRFSENMAQKRIRYTTEFNSLIKGNKTAQQYEPLWETALLHLTEVGMKKDQTDLFTAYIAKLGPELARIAMRDKRLRPSPDGQMTYRTVETWEEAHEVVKEYENALLSEKAMISQSHNYNLTQGSQTKGWLSLIHI